MKEKKKVRMTCEIYEDSKNVLIEKSKNSKFEGRYQRVARYILDKVTGNEQLLKKILK